MAEMSHGDVVQLYHDTICTYKGSPVRVTDIDRDLNVTFIMLRHGKSAKAKFDADLFGPPLARIGFVNEGTHCVFVTRQPVRRFQVGLNRGNVKLHSMPFTDRKAAERDYNLVYRMNTKGWAKALDNEYPTLAEALRIVTEHKGVVAFHKQFAVDSERRIYHKTTHVGSIPPRMSTTKRIVFEDQYTHLDTLVISNYDKTTRTIAAKAN